MLVSRDGSGVDDVERQSNTIQLASHVVLRSAMAEKYTSNALNAIVLRHVFEDCLKLPVLMSASRSSAGREFQTDMCPHRQVTVDRRPDRELTTQSGQINRRSAVERLLIDSDEDRSCTTGLLKVSFIGFSDLKPDLLSRYSAGVATVGQYKVVSLVIVGRFIV